MSLRMKHLYNMTASMAQGQLIAVYIISKGPEPGDGNSTQPRREFNTGVTSKNNFSALFNLKKKKKVSSFLTVCYLGMSRGVFETQQWPQDREALEDSAETNAAARLRLRPPSSGSLWPSLSLCKNQCLPMMCYVKFPEAWCKWLDILHASLVILQCIAPESTWTLHEKQM